jgi:hypothetical protein
MTIRMPRWTAALAGTALAVLLSGCAAGPRLYVNREADLSYYHKVAVVQFNNLCNDAHAGARVTRALVTELSISDHFQMVDPAAFWGELERAGALPDAQGAIDPVKLKDIATRLEVTGVIRGAVTEYGIQRSGSDDFPVVSFDAELIDAATGNSVWRVSVTKKGKGRMSVFGGTGSRTFASVTQEACQEAVAALRRKAF